jgi:hypothetical protein
MTYVKANDEIMIFTIAQCEHAQIDLWTQHKSLRAICVAHVQISGTDSQHSLFFSAKNASIITGR